MKNTIYSFLAFTSILFFASCSKSNDTINTPSCAAVTNFTLVQQADALKLNINASGSPLFYELSIVEASSSGGPGSFLLYNLTTTSATLPIDSINLLPGNYVAYVRAACSASDKSDWTAAQAITVSNYCDRPTNLGFSVYPDGWGFNWQTKSGTNSTSFQVQYGIKGFALGTGITKNLSSSPYTEAALTANTYYDFYVRSSCSGALGFSGWSGPYTYLATANQHLCLAPTNATYTIERNGLGQPVGANFQWNKNGETNFEFTFVSSGQPVTSGTIQTIGNFGWPTIVGIFQDTNYDFYVRSVCVDGSKTAWLGPLLFNIGH